MEIRKKIEAVRVVGYNCDVCGNSCRNMDGRYCTDELAVLSAEWGYESRRDGMWSECHMCEDCFDRVTEFIESIGGKVRTSESRSQEEGRDYVLEHGGNYPKPDWSGNSDENRTGQHEGVDL